MGGFKRTVTVSYGFVQAVCDLTSSKAPDPDSSLVQVCTAGGHAPTKPKWDPLCPTCSTAAGKPVTVSRSTLAKAREVSKDTFVVFTPSEVTDLKGDDDQYKGKLALTAHEAVEVQGKTMPSGTTYYLAPNPKDQFYGLLRQMIVDNPDLAFMGRYTVTSRASTYLVRPYGDVLVAEQMLAPEEMVQAPSYTPVAVPQQMLDMAQQVARGFVTPFDPAAYADVYRQRLSEAIQARQAEPGAALPTGVASATPGVDPMEAMRLQMEQMLAASGTGSTPPAGEKQTAPRKRAPRKKAVA